MCCRKVYHNDTRPNGEWGYSTRRLCWATSTQGQCHLQEELNLPTFSHLLIVNKLPPPSPPLLASSDSDITSLVTTPCPWATWGRLAWGLGLFLILLRTFLVILAEARFASSPVTHRGYMADCSLFHSFRLNSGVERVRDTQATPSIKSGTHQFFLRRDPSVHGCPHGCGAPTLTFAYMGVRPFSEDLCAALFDVCVRERE